MGVLNEAKIARKVKESGDRSAEQLDTLIAEQKRTNELLAQVLAALTRT